jgi:hypothetical protein
MLRLGGCQAQSFVNVKYTTCEYNNEHNLVDAKCRTW